jgi:transcriptional regulator with XRE-family HTH domain
MSKKQHSQTPTLKQLIKQKGIDQSALSTAVDIHPNTISNWQRGVSRPRIDQAVLVCLELGVSLKTFCRSIGIEVDQVPDDAPPVLDPDLQRLLDNAAQAIKLIEEYKSRTS